MQTPPPSRGGDATPRRAGGAVTHVRGSINPTRAALVSVLHQNLQTTTQLLVTLNESTSDGDLKNVMALARKNLRQQDIMFASLGMSHHW
jgi:hypothetical protein